MATYYDLYIQCPACIKDFGYDSEPPAQWYHNNCGGKIQIGDDAYYKCLSCGHSSHIQNWVYRCSRHTDFRYTTAAHFANAVSVAGALTGKAGRQWLLNLITNLGDW
ncbi:hypothetical protein [Limnospira fusiformis]|uniref:hypothetical protein n=1 Tax=Limnospira fusiformis TaxID=54297 RepID=UPI002AA13E58|nr:hypothetical protein [Limnospira fusiformis LS22]